MQIELDGYKNITLLGSGGFGNVYVGEEELSGKKVAIKKLHDNLFRDRDIIIKEIRTISKFNHPNIVQYHVAFVKDGVLYFVMEYCVGGSLANSIRNKVFDLNKAIDTILTISKALHTIHQKGIIHGDIKPENLFLGDNNEVKIGDFGCANSTSATAKYLPPEKLLKSVYNSSYHRDIFALGITFIELIQNKRIFEFLNANQRADKIISCDLGINESPLWVQEIIMKMISVNPEYRFKSMQEVTKAIETHNIPFEIDEDSISASYEAKRLSNLFKRKKYYTLLQSIKILKPDYMNHSSILEVLGRYYVSIADYKNAKDIFLALIKKVPSININKEMGQIYIEEGEIGLAIKHLTEYLLIHPEDCEAYNLLLECYFKSDRISDGLKLSNKLESLFPKELCFKINNDLFNMLNNSNDLDYVGCLMFNEGNVISDFNRSIIINNNSVLGESNTIKDKLIFCHYSISKSFTLNKLYSITIDGEEYQNNNLLLISIGRLGYKNDISFPGTHISRKQAVLILAENENWIYPLKGLSVYVDGEKLERRKRLYFKHDIEIGGHLIELNVDKTKLF